MGSLCRICASWRDVVTGAESPQLRSHKAPKREAKGGWPALPVLGGTSELELRQLRASPDRVNFVCVQLHRLINERRADGGVWVDAPVLAQLYRVLSDGMLGFRQA